MKFNLPITLRNITLIVIFISTYFTANAFTTTICVRIPQTATSADIDNYNYYYSSTPRASNSWVFSMPGWGDDASLHFTLPTIAAANVDYCTPSGITINDKVIPLLLTYPLTIHEYPGYPAAAMDPIIIPQYAIAAYKYCKIELLCRPTSGGHFSCSFTITPIQCGSQNQKIKQATVK